MNILFFGPNGSGKGTQGTILKDKYNVAHIESGGIFRENIILTRGRITYRSK